MLANQQIFGKILKITKHILNDVLTSPRGNPIVPLSCYSNLAKRSYRRVHRVAMATFCGIHSIIRVNQPRLVRVGDARPPPFTISTSVADPDPGSGAFLTPGSGIQDPGWVKSQDSG